MALDFVNETPQRRGINRNNYKIIQKRATQAGARTRLSSKIQQTSKQRPNAETRTLPIRQGDARLGGRDLLANAKLAVHDNSPFLARFGRQIRLICLRDLNATPAHSCVRLPDPALSVLQQHLLLTLSAHPMREDANRLFKITVLTSNQLLGHLPSHYGLLPFLDEAMECLIARLHETVPLVKSDPDTTRVQPSPTALYGKALRSLRTAIDTDLAKDLCYIWFAVMLLTLFELVSMGDEPGWIWHAAGAVRMLYKVGPENIKSEFQMSLLSLQCRIMVMETLFNNKPCYLADPRWQDALKRTILDGDEFSDRSRVSTELWAIGARIPNHFQSVAACVRGALAADAKSMIRSVDRLLLDLTTWQKHWQEILEKACRDGVRGKCIRYQALTILVAYHTLTIIANRLRVALQPYGAGKVEAKALAACLSLIRLRKGSVCRRWSPSDDSSVFAKIAVATQRSAPQWHELISNTPQGTLIDSNVFIAWCRLIGIVTQQPAF